MIVRKWGWASVMASLLILQISFFGWFPQLDSVNATLDANEPHLKIEGNSDVAGESLLSETVSIDENIPATGDVGQDLVGGVYFALMVGGCKDEPSDTDRSDGKMLGVSVGIDNSWNSYRDFNVIRVGDSHEIRVLAIASENLDTSAGRNVVKVECSMNSTDSPINQTFKEVQIVKHNPIDPLSPIMVQNIGQSETSYSEEGQANDTDALPDNGNSSGSPAGTDGNFEVGFYEKLKKLNDQEMERQRNEGDSYRAREYTVIIFVKEPQGLRHNPDNLETIEDVKNKLENILLRDHKALIVHKGEVLSYVAARVPIGEIMKLGSYEYVDLYLFRWVRGIF